MAPAAGDPPHQLSDFAPETIRGTPGFVRVGRTRAGAWWLIAPDDRALDACDAADGTSPGQSPWWDVHTLGVAEGRPPANWTGRWVGAVRFRSDLPGAAIHLQGVHLPDVFDPGWTQSCRLQAAGACPAGLDDPRLIGWLPDPDLQWRQSAGGLPRPGLLQVCLSLEPRFAAYHAAWEFALAAHDGNLVALAKSWEADVPNKESLRLLTHEDRALGSAGYRHDDDRFTREFARLYFATAAAALREADPAHLVIGAIPSDGPAVVGEAAAPLVDLLSPPAAVVRSR